MKKTVKKLNLNKMSILKLNETPNIKGGFRAPLEASGVQGCGGAKTQPKDVGVSLHNQIVLLVLDVLLKK